MAAVLGAGALAGCAAGASTIDSRQVDVKLLDFLHRERPGVTAEVACPHGIPIHPGTTFSCSVVLDGSATSYTVRIDNVAGSRYAIAASPSEPIFDTQQVAAAVKQQEGAGAAVDCGKARFVQVAVRGTFRCSVTAGGQRQDLTATVTDPQGGVTFASGPAAPVATTTVPAGPPESTGGGAGGGPVTLPGGG
ncbi:MAG TPA: DUF4333 domain-containing protein [Acidimicrobiales bacterium]